MTAAEAAKILRAHNAWRRGGDGPATDPEALGMALDIAAKAMDDITELRRLYSDRHIRTIRTLVAGRRAAMILRAAP